MEGNPYDNVNQIHEAIPDYAVPGEEPKGYSTYPHTPETRKEEDYFDADSNYNPKPYGGNSPASGQPVPGAGRMFNDKGEINAYDKGDALQHIAYLLNNVTRQPEGIKAFRRESSMTKEQRRDILAQAYHDPTGEGFQIISQAMLGPVLSIVRYEGLTDQPPYSVTGKVKKVGELGETPSGTIPSRAPISIGEGVETMHQPSLKKDDDIVRASWRHEEPNRNDSATQ